jgi:hypothetical protein
LRQQHTQKKSACKITRFQVRKVHENLVGAQPARLIFFFFFLREVGLHARREALRKTFSVARHHPMSRPE